MFGAYTKNTLHSVQVRDFEPLSGILGGSVMGAATYAAQVHPQSLGPSDRDDFLNKRLSAKALASAAMSRGTPGRCSRSPRSATSYPWCGPPTR